MDLHISVYKGKLIIIPVRLQSLQSGFIVFREKQIFQKNKRKNFPTWELKKTITGSWEVSFDTSRGGPLKIVFPEYRIGLNDLNLV